jgi:hypothetical protein
MTEIEQQRIFTEHLRQVRSRVESRDGYCDTTRTQASSQDCRAPRRRMRRKTPSDRTLLMTSYKRFVETMR